MSKTQKKNFFGVGSHLYLATGGVLVGTQKIEPKLEFFPNYIFNVVLLLIEAKYKVCWIISFELMYMSVKNIMVWPVLPHYDVIKGQKYSKKVKKSIKHKHGLVIYHLKGNFLNI